MKDSLITLSEVMAALAMHRVSKLHHYENKTKVVINWPLNAHGAHSAIHVSISPLQTFCSPVWLGMEWNHQWFPQRGGGETHSGLEGMASLQTITFEEWEECRRGRLDFYV